MAVDDVLKLIGEFGRFQLLIYTVVCITSMGSSMVTFCQVFLAATVDHWCAVGEWSEQESACWDHRGDDESHLNCLHRLRDASIPYDEAADGYANCEKYDAKYPTVWYEGYDAQDYTNVTTGCDDGYVYDLSQYRSTVVTEFDLVCERESLTNIEQTLFFVGYCFGPLILGTVADKYGRYKAYFISVTGVMIFGILSALATKFWMFAIMRFMQGFCDMVYGLAFTIGIEIAGPSKRVWAGTVICLFFSGGYMVLAVMAFFITNWRHLQMVVSSMFLLCFLYIRVLPESVRWLISMKKYGEVEKLLRKIADGNRTSEKLPDDFMEHLRKEEEEELSSQQKEKRNANVLDLFRTKKLRWNTLNLMFNWTINSLVYYGISLSTSSLGKNDYIAFFISGAVEIPAYLICIPMVESFLGRRGTTVLLEIIAGLACICTAFLPEGMTRLAIGMIGKFCISTTFAVIYIYSAEIFPTPVRTVGTAVCTTTANVAAVFGSLILIMGEVWEPLPYIVYGSTAVTGGLLALFLPETRGQNLPETVTRDGNLKEIKSLSATVQEVSNS